MKYYVLSTLAVLLTFLNSLTAQTQADAVVFYELKDALWNQTTTTAKDSGTPGDKNGTISGTGVKFINNGGGGTAIEYSITTNDAKIDGVTADWGEKFVLEARIKKSALEESGTNSEIHILKNVVTTGLDWFINTDGKMVLKVGDGTNINVISQNAVLTDDSWITLAVAVDLTQTTLADAVKFFVNGASTGSGGGGSEPEPDPILNEVVFDQTVNSDIATNPIDITGLDGDLYDYTLVINADNAGVSNSISLTVNNDTTANYRYNYIRGEGGSSLSSVSDSSSSFFLMDQPGYNEPGMALVKISGSATEEKNISAFSSGATSSKKVYRFEGAWKNTTDKLTSIQVNGSGTGNFKVHVRAYRTPKNQSDDRWELVDSQSWTNQNLDSTPVSFDGLTSQSESKYKLVVSFDDASHALKMRCNDDSGNNYTNQLLWNLNGAKYTQVTTSTELYYSSYMKNFEFIIRPKSGAKRLIESRLTTPSTFMIDGHTWWNNTTDELTKLTITHESANSSGTAWLFKQKDSEGQTDQYNLPFQKISEVDINGNFSSGHTFSGLTGDSQFIYKIEFVGNSGVTAPDVPIYVQFNGDTGSNYPKQFFRGYSTTIDAQSSTQTHLDLTSGIYNTGFGEMWIYPKSGAERTVLNMAAADYNGGYQMFRRAGWWSNTTDEITSIKVFSGNSTTVTGKLILSAIPLDTTGQQAQPETPPQYAAGSSFKVFDETFTARNFNTNPLTIPNLEGDTYDYKGFVILNNGGDNLFLYNRLNGDTGNNYRNYYMRGGGSTSSASVNDNSSGIQTGFSNSAPSLMMFEITGSTGSERAVNYFSANESTAGRYVYNVSNFWKNTTDEITNLDFYYTSSATVDARIILYAIPKTGNKGNWELVESIDFTSQDIGTGASPISFDGLDGNTDEEYKIEFEGECVGNSYYGLWINNDSGSNYSSQELYNTSSVNAYTRSGSSYFYAGQGESSKVNRAEFRINTKTGSNRFIQFSTSHNGANSARQLESAGWWNNTIDNITSIQIRANAGTSQVWSGNAKIYKRKDPAGTGGDLHWETLSSETINGSLAAGHTFTGLTGDTEVLYKIEGHGQFDGDVRLEINGDTANYVGQNFYGVNGAVYANTSGVIFVSSFSGATQTSSWEAVVYPKSGSSRPILCSAGAQNATQTSRWFNASWWNNTTDEITSIKVYTTGSSSVQNTIKISRLVDPQPIEETGGTGTAGQVALDSSSTYTENIYATISGENAIEMLTKTGDFSLQADFLKMTLKRTDGAFDASQIQIGEGYRVDENYNVLTQTASKIFVYPPKLLRRVYNPPADFDTLGRPKAGVTVDIVTSPVVSKVYYGLFQFEFALDKVLSENVTVDVFMKTNDFDFKKIAEVKPTAKPADPEAPWIIKYYWNSRVNQFDWDGNAYKTAGAVEFKFEVR